MDADELVAAGRGALRECRWEDALASFEAVLASGESPEALDGLAEVRYWQGDYASAIDLRERAYAGFRTRGETRYPAKLAAYHLAFDYAALYGNFAVASGWLERGRRLAEVSGDCSERGWVELACVLATGDPDAKDRHIAAALAIARRFGDADLEFDALAYAGVGLVERGRFREGMRHLDEAAAAARGGEVASPTAAGEIYCKMLLACEMALDVRRAEQWIVAANSLAGRANVRWASAICRMYYGGILVAAGRWSEAEDELGTSARIYAASYASLRSGAVVRLADLRIRQGRLDEAERLLAGHDHDAYAVRPLASLHLARGEADVAATLLRRHLAQHGQGPTQAPTLSLLVEAHVTAGRVDAAREACARLATVAAEVPTPMLRGYAAVAAGLVAVGTTGVGPGTVAAGPGTAADTATGHLEAALVAFNEAGLPLEAARARVALARLLSTTQPQVARSEARTALDVFDRLGARPDADATASLLRSLGARGRTGPKHLDVLSRREREVLQLLGLGLSNAEIAGRLFISAKTASHHVSNVLAKLGLRNRAEAAAFASVQPATLDDGQGPPTTGSSIAGT
ncbi:MAG TPA: LuxR C-terminal-related transcriptional regulator [Pilimelia sp.]|nr:LuxR C-terminal-related transcriptional regulator [Pilimelia sp.]